MNCRFVFARFKSRVKRHGFFALTIAVGVFLHSGAALAQTWGAGLCQYGFIEVADQSGPIVWQYQYPSSSGCATVLGEYGYQLTQTTAPVPNSIQSGSIQGSGVGYSDTGDVTLAGIAQLGELSVASDVLANAEGGAATSEGIQNMSWADVLTITSSTLPTGTLVHLNFTENISGQVVPPPSNVATLSFLVSGNDGVNISTLLPPQELTSFNGSSSASAALPVHVGDTFSVGGQMIAQILSDASGDQGSLEGFINGTQSGSNPDFTFSVTIDPVEPCTGYTSASGLGYYSTPPTCQSGSSCSITSQTVAQQPPDTARKTLGVGEDVTLNLLGGDDSTTWELNGPGSIAQLGASEALYMADGSTGDAVITAISDTCSKAATIKLKVIAPSKVVMQRPQNNYDHTQGQPDIGFEADIYIGPSTVSFANLAFQEVNGPFAATGVYAFENGDLHCGSAGCTPFAATDNVVSGLGTELDSQDCVYSGYPGTPPPYAPGSVSILIPWQWYLGDGSNPVTFLNVAQTAELQANGKTLNAKKAGATVTETVASADGTVTCQNN